MKIFKLFTIMFLASFGTMFIAMFYNILLGHDFDPVAYTQSKIFVWATISAIFWVFFGLIILVWREL